MLFPYFEIYILVIRTAGLNIKINGSKVTGIYKERKKGEKVKKSALIKEDGVCSLENWLIMKRI